MLINVPGENTPSKHIIYIVPQAGGSLDVKGSKSVVFLEIRVLDWTYSKIKTDTILHSAQSVGK